MENTELIKALRCCVTDYNNIQSRLCNKCPYAKYADGKYGCENKLKADAADALEAADEKIADYTAAIDALDDSNDAYIKENERLKKRIAELSLDNKMLKNTIDADKGVMLDRIRFLEAQLPKRGKWIGIEYDGYADGYPVYDVWECSECGEEHNGEEDTLPNYCPNCGAKMKGEQE